MTNKERIESFLGFGPGNDNSVLAELQDAGLNGSSVYDSSNRPAMLRAAKEVMKILLTTADNTNQQPLYTIKYDRAMVVKRIQMIDDELGIAGDAVPTIKGLQVW